ncbi:ornithine carbamoyltransferase [uncultured Clostridium sp.]|uniref:ornithine carbamoyltransferase n=1 Tax=uncultured Clostridium sp. TaxID=59620 RepID=UPI002603C23F|nr:ornithine carbamoyltransferase [uncultured Clostridium sp.]
MAVNLKGKSFLSLMDLEPFEIRYLLDLSHDLKAKKRAGIKGDLLEGKNIVLLFEKTSTRTRCSFEVAAMDEGAGVTFLSNSQMGKKESIEDTAKVLGRMYDGIEFRGYEQSTVEKLAKYSGVPVWNGLTDIDHPTQILADFMTIEEKLKKPLNKVKLVFVGDIRNNMSYALMYGAAKMGMHFVALGPKELEVDKSILDKVSKVASQTGAKIEITHEISGTLNADVVYTDIWCSMGEEDKMVERYNLLKDYKITKKFMASTKNPECLFMHCLPAYHNFDTEVASKAKLELGIDIREVDDDVFKSNNSVVFDEAENRMHTIKAVIVATIGK